MSVASHPINVVARLTGLSPFVIRIWEQRYGVVKPQRTGTNRRLYSEQQIERLKLLREVTRAGHGIGLIAGWPMEKLRQQAAETAGASPVANRVSPATPTPVDSLILECVAAMKALDNKAFDNVLKRGEVGLGTVGLLQRVVAPLAQRIGDLWIAGSITVAHEHLATSVLRAFLLNTAKPFGQTEHSPRLVVATPAGQLHELGALLVGAMAAHLDWQITYLGASLPAAEIAGAARQIRARAVALSLVYPEDDPRLPGELELMRELLPPAVAVLTGGRALPAYREAVLGIGAVPTGDLSDLAVKLETLRKPTSKKTGRKRRAK